MPDMDTNWERVRQKLPEFVSLARTYHATSVLPLSQANLLKAINPESSGICYGLSMGYLIEINTPGSSSTRFVELAHHWASVASEKGKIGAMTHEVYKLGNWSGRINSFQSYWPAKYRTVEEFRDAGLTTEVAWDVTFDQILRRFTKVAEYITGCSSVSAILIKTPNHAMAAFVKNGSYGFFDPNFGEVTFASPKNFTGFFVKWFDKDFIQKAYKGTAGGRKDAPPAKSLVLKLCVFAP
jgi:YopT-type cysteine protease-like protein